MGRIKMAELSKKLYIKNTEGVTQSAKLYSTTSESQTPYLSLKVDNINCYASLTDVSDSRATSGRIKKSDGTILAIGESGTSPYGYSLFTTSGSFTVPAGITKLRVTCIGGGAGGGTDYGPGELALFERKNVSTVYSRSWTNSGGETAFWRENTNEVKASGGTAVSYTGTGRARNYPNNPANWYIVEDTITSFTDSKGYHNGTHLARTADIVNGASGVSLTLLDGTVVGTYGAGGYGDGDGDKNGNVAASGASGYRTVGTLYVTPGHVYTATVGGGGYGWWRGGNHTGGNSGGSGCSMGSSGAILVEWGQGIQ